MKSPVKPLAAAIFLAFAAPGMAATATWDFNFPATGLDSTTPPYPTLGSLTLTDVAGGVQFVMDPDETNPGYSLTPNNTSVVSRIDFVYSGAALTGTDFQYDSGAMVQSFSYWSNPNNMDAGFVANDQHIVVDFYSSPQDDFEVTNTSTWTILGTSVDDFINTFATSNNKAVPIFGVLSVNPFSNPDLTPNTSNWVAAAPIPEPETYAMLLAGLGMLGFIGRRRYKNQSTVDMEIGPTARCV